MLGTLEDDQKSDWKAHVPTLVHAYNCTQHDSTGYSPYYLMFGRHPRLAIDAFLGLRPDEMHATRSSEYIRKLSDRLDKAYAEATKEAKKSAKKQKRVYDKNVRSSLLHPGDRVLLRNVSIRGKHKLADRWERQPYIVKRQPISGIPVYEIVSEHARSRKLKTVHRNLLLPFMSVSSAPRDDAKEPGATSRGGDDGQLATPPVPPEDSSSSECSEPDDQLVRPMKHQSSRTPRHPVVTLFRCSGNLDRRVFFLGLRL